MTAKIYSSRFFVCAKKPEMFSPNCLINSKNGISPFLASPADLPKLKDKERKMAKTSWQGTLYYEGTGVGVENNNFTRTKLSGTIPVRYFNVDGGSRRMIYFDSTGDLPVWSELDQAKKNGNIMLGLSPDVTAASHFTILSKIEFPLNLVFSVGNGSNVYSLRTEKAFFAKAPSRVDGGGETVTSVKFKIRDCELIEGLMGMKIQSGAIKFNQ